MLRFLKNKQDIFFNMNSCNTYEHLKKNIFNDEFSSVLTSQEWLLHVGNAMLLRVRATINMAYLNCKQVLLLLFFIKDK